jgi:hypothetical protein
LELQHKKHPLLEQLHNKVSLGFLRFLKSKFFGSNVLKIISILSLLKEVPIIESKKSLELMETSKKNAQNAQATLAANAGAQQGGAGGNFAPVLTTTKGDLTSLISVGLIGALNTNGTSNTSVLASNLFASGSALAEESNFNKRLLSRYGCYLIIALIKPNENRDLEVFGRIVSMVLEWFHLVCYIPSDASGEIISKIRTNVTFLTHRGH